MPSLPSWALRGRAKWKNTGRERPSFAGPPGPGQESVWDFPRPPRLVADHRHVEVRVGDIIVAQSTRAVRILETASPPTFYLPPASVQTNLLVPTAGTSQCEWKGVASYFDVVVGSTRIEAAAWTYPHPFPEYEALRDHVSFYPGRIECLVGTERVAPQSGAFYGGWVTSELVGPFKGEPGSEDW